MNTYTKGPWHVGGNRNSTNKLETGLPRVWGPDGAAIADICTRRPLGEVGPSIEEISNAILIAAVLDLLALAKDVDAMVQQWRETGREPSFGQFENLQYTARAAIAKATG